MSFISMQNKYLAKKKKMNNFKKMTSYLKYKNGLEMRNKYVNKVFGKEVTTRRENLAYILYFLKIILLIKKSIS